LPAATIPRFAALLIWVRSAKGNPCGAIKYANYKATLTLTHVGVGSDTMQIVDCRVSNRLLQRKKDGM